MMAAAAFLGLDAGNALKIYRRDRHNHASPNSAKTEAVMAGALNLRLAGDAYYFGRLVKKPTIGDDNRPITPEDIPCLLYTSRISGCQELLRCRRKQSDFYQSKAAGPLLFAGQALQRSYAAANLGR